MVSVQVGIKSAHECDRKRITGNDCYAGCQTLSPRGSRGGSGGGRLGGSCVHCRSDNKNDNSQPLVFQSSSTVPHSFMIHSLLYTVVYYTRIVYYTKCRIFACMRACGPTCTRVRQAWLMRAQWTCTQVDSSRAALTLTQTTHPHPCQH